MDYRLKTEEEFFEEFGPDWAVIVFGLSPVIGFCFGQELSEFSYRQVKEHNLAIGQWCIYPNMVIENIIYTCVIKDNTLSFEVRV